MFPSTKILDPTKEDILLWTSALRSGTFKQTKDRLQDANGYCCLGVACSIFIDVNKLQRNGLGEIVGCNPAQQKCAPYWLQKINSRFERLVGASLEELNDCGDRFTFDEIADLIELVYIHEAFGSLKENVA